MTKPVLLRPEAQLDLEDAAQWYNRQRGGLGYEFLDEVVRGFASISENSLLYPIVHKNIRRSLLRRFPFGVFYIDEPDKIVVIGVMHGSRDPKTWKTRT
jgi:plasmid stabilization system protein ParE